MHRAAGPQASHEREWSQDQLAAKLQFEGLENFDRVTVAKVESQIRSVFDFELQMIAKTFGVEAKHLLPTSGALKKDLPHLLAGERPNP